MSKFVKNLITDHLKERLEGVNDAIVVDVVGMDAGATSSLRKAFREQSISMMVVKNSLARRATEGTPLGAAFEGVEGSAAIVWGSEDIVSLAKSVVEVAKKKEFEKFSARGGVMDGSHLSPEMVTAVSKWPSRGEQLSLLVGQILAPGANLVSQLTSVGGALASQIKQKGEEEGAEG